MANTSSLGDFIVTHRTDQPFPVIFLKLLCQMAVVPRWAWPWGCSISSDPVLTSQGRKWDRHRKEGTVLG